MDDDELRSFPSIVSFEETCQLTAEHYSGSRQNNSINNPVSRLNWYDEMTEVELSSDPRHGGEDDSDHRRKQ